jgi:hypothetical protein
MRLQSECPPNLIHSRATQPARLRHVADAPVRRAARRLFQRAHDHLFNLLIADPPGRAGTRLVIQPVEPIAQKPAAPFTHRGLRHPQAFRHRCVGVPLGTGEHDPRATREVRGRTGPMGQRVESHAFVFRQNQRYLWTSQSHTRLLVDEYDRAAPFISLSSRSGH